MNSEDITNTVLIILIFAIINIVSILGIGISQIQDNWNEYKCMPIVIPFAGVFGKDSKTTFDECIEGIQKNSISDMLGPVYSIFTELNKIGEQIGKFMIISNSLGNFFKNSLLDGTINIYQVIAQLRNWITNVSIKIQDIMRKMAAVIVTITYVIYSLEITAVSIWHGLPGQLVRDVTRMADMI